MSKLQIVGKEYYLKHIFGNGFRFIIPRYQRPYAWTIEETGELLDDLRGQGTQAENKAIFDQLLAKKAEIDAAFVEGLDWQRMNDMKACIIGHTIKLGGWRDPEKWPEIQKATADAMVRLEKALTPAIAALPI